MRTNTLKSQVLAVFAMAPDARYTAKQFARSFGKAEVYFSAMLSQLFKEGLISRHDIAVNRHKRYSYSFKSQQQEEGPHGLG
jgi:hypothetical protein